MACEGGRTVHVVFFKALVKGLFLFAREEVEESHICNVFELQNYSKFFLIIQSASPALDNKANDHISNNAGNMVVNMIFQNEMECETHTALTFSTR